MNGQPIHIRESIAELLLTWRRQRVASALRRTDRSLVARPVIRARHRYDDLVAAEQRRKS